MAKKTLATLTLIGTIALVGCGKREYSDVKHEDGVVVGMTYIPAHHEHSLDPVIIPFGDGALGLSVNGEIGIKGTLAEHDEDIPAKYEVKIKTEDKTFRLYGQEAELVYDKLKKGEKVDVTYKDVYRAFYKDTNNDGKKELVKRKLTDYEFVDANPKDK